jgi:hypothetical protein
MHRKSDNTGLWMAIALWLCTIPVLLLVAPRFIGWRTTWYLLGALVLADLLLCWYLFTYFGPGKKPGRPSSKQGG